MKPKQTKKKKVELPGELGLQPIAPTYRIMIEVDPDKLVSISNDEGDVVVIEPTKSEAEQIGEWFLKLSEALGE